MNRKNLASATVDYLDIGNIYLESGDGLNMPEAPFYATAAPPGVMPSMKNSEIVLVTEKDVDMLKVTRARYGTTQQDIENGWVLFNGIYVQDIQQLESKIQEKEPTANKSNDQALGISNELFPTQGAVKQYVDNAIALMKESQYPVGSLYFNADNDTNPAALLGFGTWSAYAQGRVPVGKSNSGTFSTLGGTMGAETHTLSIAEMPTHVHSKGHISFVAGPGPGNPNPEWAGVLHNSGWGKGTPDYTGSTGDANYPNTGPMGGGAAHNNIQPSIVVNIWRRTA